MRRSWTRALFALALIGMVACEPHDRRPGQWLHGEVVATPVTDWSFSNGVDEIFVETATWYVVPHSVTTTVVTSDGTLYVPSLYYEGGEFPTERFWNRNIARDPNVRLDGWREMLKNGDPEKPKIVLLRMDPRSA
jgi:hypothetical protein